MTDLAILTRALNALAQPTNAQAWALLINAKDAIDQAIAYGDDDSLPGAQTRLNVQAIVDEQLNAVSSAFVTGQDDAPYDDVAGLRTACTRAAIELNATIVGKEARAAFVGQLFADMATNAVELPAKIAKVGGQALQEVAQPLLDAGKPLLAGIGVVLALALVAFLVIESK